MEVLRERLHVSQTCVRPVIMPIDRSINVPSLPMISVTTGDSPRKPYIDVTPVGDVEPKLPVEALRKQDDVRELPGSKRLNPVIDFFDSAQVEPSSSPSIFSLIDSR